MGDGSNDGWHHADPRRFREALEISAAASGFSARLIEKDYYCSLILRDLARPFDRGLVFKGGTCLSKVHAEFFRLSEDLDFAVSLSPDARRSERRRTAGPFKDHLKEVSSRLPCFEMTEEIRGRNESRHYAGEFAYRSAVTGERGFIKLEISLREPIVMPSEARTARALLNDADTGRPAIAPFQVRVLCRAEAYAEKVRAALTRHPPAIRDYFDIDHAVRLALLDHQDPALLELVRAKLSVDGNGPIDLSTDKCRLLQGQIGPQLRPVLRSKDYESFELSRVIAILEELARSLNGDGR